MISKALNLGASVTRKSRFRSAEKEFSIERGVVWMYGYIFLCPEATNKGILLKDNTMKRKINKIAHRHKEGIRLSLLSTQDCRNHCFSLKDQGLKGQ